MVKKLLVFFVLFIPLVAPLVTWAAPQVSYCNIGADPVDAHRKQYLEKGEYIATLESDAFVTMRAGSGREVSCIVRKGEEVVFNTNGSLPWIKKCGNTILSGLWSPEPPEKFGLSDTDKYLLGRNARPAYVVQVYECDPGTVCFARAQQFRFNLNLGAEALGIWNHGLKANNYSLNNSQGQNQGQGQGQIAEGGSGGAGGEGGAGGNGGGGGSGGGPVNPPNGPPSVGPISPPNGPPSVGPVPPPNGPVNPVN